MKANLLEALRYPFFLEVRSPYEQWHDNPEMVGKRQAALKPDIIQQQAQADMRRVRNPNSPIHKSAQERLVKQTSFKRSLADKIVDSYKKKGIDKVSRMSTFMRAVPKMRGGL